uniref:Uncharacterized protein n=1 Tax=Clytia hemisphaerica TaxID=252671 RepID=A0A7M5XNA8_9CNID
MSAQAKKSNPPKPADNRWKRPPFKGTVWEVDLAPPSSSSAYIELEYKGITEGGAIHGQYWDGRVENWCKDKCYTFEAISPTKMHSKSPARRKTSSHYMTQEKKLQKSLEP